MSIIPRNIFQTHCTPFADLPVQLQEMRVRWINSHPDFKYHYFDDEACRHFLETHFDIGVVSAYDSVLPGAFKADIWRLGVLYIYGGFYLDIKFGPPAHYTLQDLAAHQVNGLFLVQDHNDSRIGVYNAVMGASAGNPIFRKALALICSNVHDRRYGQNCLDITGPAALHEIFSPYINKLLRHRRGAHATIEDFKFDTVFVPPFTPVEYRNFLATNSTHYPGLWTQRRVFKPSRSVDYVYGTVEDGYVKTLVLELQGVRQVYNVNEGKDPIILTPSREFSFKLGQDERIVAINQYTDGSECNYGTRLELVTSACRTLVLWGHRHSCTNSRRTRRVLDSSCQGVSKLVFDTHQNLVALDTFSIATIPKKIWQTWSTKHLPTSMQTTVDQLQEQHPDFQYTLHDDHDCREFLLQNFDRCVLDSYNTLIPGAFRADLWRLCAVYVHGGFYLDIKYGTENGFRLDSLVEAGCVFTKERQPYAGCHNAFFGSYPKNPLFFDLIQKIVRNVQSRQLEGDPINVTGPLVFKDYLEPESLDNCQFIYDHPIQIRNQRTGSICLRQYQTYRAEQTTTLSLPHYAYLWDNQLVYNLPLRNVEIHAGDFLDALVLGNWHYPKTHGGGLVQALELQTNEYLVHLEHGIDSSPHYIGVSLYIHTNLGHSIGYRCPNKSADQTFTLHLDNDHCFLGCVFRGPRIHQVLIFDRVQLSYNMRTISADDYTYTNSY
jgi:mannosyltransferase OCH1-like enzyme